MKRCLVLLTLVLLLPLSALAQEQPPAEESFSALLDWVPADFAGFIWLDSSQPQVTLPALNLHLTVARVLQFSRVSEEGFADLNALFPLDRFDLEGGSFDSLILPWLGGELIAAYRQLDGRLDADPRDTLLIAATDDPFQALSVMRAALGGQDLLESSSYRGVTIYAGDQTAFAFTPAAVLIGDEALIRAALDAEAGAVPGLTDSAVYQSVTGALTERIPIRAAPLYAYLTGDAAAAAPRRLLDYTGDGDPLFDALLEALANLTPEAASPSAQETLAAERALLSGSADALGIWLSYDDVRFESLRADVVIHSSSPLAADAAFDMAVLDYIPRSAAFVHSGADAQRAVYGALAALPLANFASRALSAFPLVQPTAGSEVLPAPDAAQARAAVEGFLTIIGESGVNLRGDLLDKLTGSYSVALLPRPNNPTAALNTPFDLLAVAQSDDPAVAVETLTNALRLFVGDSVEVETLELRGESLAVTALRAPGSGDPVLMFGVVGEALVIGTGDALPLAVRAWQGDNRLMDQARWSGVGGGAVPYIYADIGGVYSTFIPAFFTQTSAATSIRQVGVTSQALDETTLYLRMTTAIVLQ
jgi:hypothetical protein